MGIQEAPIEEGKKKKEQHLDKNNKNMNDYPQFRLSIQFYKEQFSFPNWTLDHSKFI